MTNTGKAVIEVQNLSKIYRKRGSRPEVKAVDNLSLKVWTGEVFGFLGANGAGKTTTIKMICGLLTPSSGRITLNGYPVTDRRNAMRQIGAVLEGTRNIYWRLSAWQNLMYFGRLKGETGRPFRQRAEFLLKELGLWERRHDPIRMFSRGMQQKVAIACALIADPPVVLLDEPTLGLDVQAARTVKEWIEVLTRERGKTVVLTTHQLDMAQALCDRIAIMSQGRMVANKPTHELLNLFRQEFYEIKIGGHLDGAALVLPSTLTQREENGCTVFSGGLADQRELYQVIDQARALGLPLISVTQVEPNLEDIFIRLLEERTA